MPSADDLLDIQQAATLLQVSETSLRRWTDQGKLACLRVGGRRERRFRRADLEAFMEQQPALWHGVEPAAQASVAYVAGIPVPHGSHFAGLYKSEEGLTKLAVAFLADGLAQGSACFLLAEPDRARMISDTLRGSRSAATKAPLTLMQYKGSTQAQIDAFESTYVAALRSGATSLRTVGDVWGFAQNASMEEVVQYEAEFDRCIAKRFPGITLCAYDVRRFSGERLYDALRGHPDIFRYPADRLLG
jgi:transcriptional repressor of dcmA and dcmR